MASLPPKPERNNPRRRERRRNKANAAPTSEGVPTFDVDDLSRISFVIPDEIKIAFASAMMAFTAMEQSAEHLVWDLVGISYDDGRLLTRMDTKERFELLKVLMKRYNLPAHPNPKTTTEMWTAVRHLIEARNRMAHGAWHMLDQQTPIAVSTRLPTELGRVTGESFTLSRLNAIERQCLRVKRQLDDAAVRLSSSPPTRPLPPHPRTPSPPQPLPTDPK